ncbi:unnamed protein product, partial [Mesorhabditis spiculigera]
MADPARRPLMPQPAVAPPNAANGAANGAVEPNTLEYYDNRTTLGANPRRYEFNYIPGEADGANATALERVGNDYGVIDWRTLRKLKDEKNWALIKHPMVLNYVNERLLECAVWYTLHIIIYFIFLVVLSWHVYWKTLFKAIIISIFVIFLFFITTVKAVRKAQIEESCSGWAVAGLVLNYATYITTGCYVWLPVAFESNDFHMEIKNVIMRILPILTIISAWGNFLYVLRKSPYGIYTFMMARIFWSFAKGKNTTSSVPTLIIVVRAIAKTLSMMIGELDANTILETKQWLPALVVVVFEVVAVILLMNLMVSLAVGDVSDLRDSALDMMLQIKVSYVIEALQISVLCKCRVPVAWHLYKNPTNAVLVIEGDGGYFTVKEAKAPYTNPDGLWTRYAKWLIGLDLVGYLPEALPEAQLLRAIRLSLPPTPLKADASSSP